MSQHLMPVYRPAPVAFTKGEGAWLWDTQGTRYLDAIAGMGVCSLGHAHPAVTAAIQEQAAELLHTSNAFQIPVQETLAKQLTEIAGMDQAFFGNSGAEANECALKLARLYGHQRGIKNPQILVMEGSFHGRTLATLSASGKRLIQAGFEPLVQGFVRAPFNDLASLEQIAKNSQSVVAVFLEPIQGEGGIHVPDDDYLEAVYALCEANQWLLIVDEIQSGMARSGRWFAHQHTSVKPHILTAAKALGNGVPIAACLARAEVTRHFEVGKHGSTFGGNPLACRAALAVIDSMQKDNIPQHAAAMGKRVLEGLRDALADVPEVLAVRGRGLMIGIEFNQPCREFVLEALAEQLLINVCGGDKVIRLLPPLIITEEQARQLVETLDRLVHAHQFK